MSFAKGLMAGQQMARGWIDQWDQGVEKREIAKIAEAKPEQSTGYTAADGQQLEKLASDGYKIDFDAAQNAYVAKNDAGDTKTVAMQGVTDFMGNRSAGSMTVEQTDGARMMAMADVIAKRDPARGMQMKAQVRRDAHDAKRQGREEKAWAREDGIEALDTQLGQEFEAGLMGEDGRRRAPTADDYLKNNQQRAFKLAQAGYAKEAQAAFKENLSTAHIKIQLDGAERKQALGPAMAALASGDYGAVADFYNKYVPSGTKVTGITAGKDGGLVMERTGMDGQPMPPLRAKDQREAMAMLQSLENPAALYQYSQDEFRNQLSLKADSRADAQLALSRNADARAGRAEGRAAASHSMQMQERRERMGITEALAKEMNPDATPAQMAAYRHGILKLPQQATGKASYDPMMIQKEFGEVTTNHLGQSSVKRNTAEENKFKQWWGDNPQIRDQQEALVLYNQQRAKGANRERAATAEKDAQHAAVVKQVRKAITPEALEATAKKYNMSIAEVRAELAKQGIVE